LHSDWFSQVKSILSTVPTLKRVSVKKAESNRPLGRPRRRWDYNIQTNLKDIQGERAVGLAGSGKVQVVSSCKDTWSSKKKKIRRIA
jgi:hypothetical protein